MGFPGVVVGVLDEEGHINLTRMKTLMALCEGMAVTFHRAFDLCLNPHVALQQPHRSGRGERAYIGSAASRKRINIIA